MAALETRCRILDERITSKSTILSAKKQRQEPVSGKFVMKKTKRNEDIMFKCFLPECFARFKTLQECDQHFNFKHTAAGRSVVMCLNEDLWDDPVIDSGISQVIEPPEVAEKVLKETVKKHLSSEDMLIRPGICLTWHAWV